MWAAALFAAFLVGVQARDAGAAFDSPHASFLHRHKNTVSKREGACQRLMGIWARRGTVSLSLVCRQAYPEAVCLEAEAALGVDGTSGEEWPSAEELSPEVVVNTACKVVEQGMHSQRGLMLNQVASSQSSRSSSHPHLRAGLATS
mmetsp:Transcript_143222/g.249795  ORF Transcript_143222/g.249795 Transcript_143222/m.249795 type:complete len:146 (-) Transcript_143222:81-518(-)